MDEPDEIHVHLVGAEASWAEAVWRLRAHLPVKTASAGAIEGSDGGAAAAAAAAGAGVAGL